MPPARNAGLPRQTLISGRGWKELAHRVERRQALRWTKEVGLGMVRFWLGLLLLCNGRTRNGQFFAIVRWVVAVDRTTRYGIVGLLARRLQIDLQRFHFYQPFWPIARLWALQSRRNRPAGADFAFDAQSPGF